MSFITSKLAGPIAGAIAIVLAIALFAGVIINRQQAKQIERLEDTVTLLSADLGTCRANTAGLTTSLAAQNAAITRLSEDAATLALEYENARKERDRLRSINETQALQILEKPFIGETQCERLLEVDKRLLETLE